MRVTFGYLWPDPENRKKISEFRDKTSIINRKKIETTNRRSVAKNSKDPRCVAKRTTRVYPAKVLHGFRYSFPRTYDDDTTFVHQIEFDCGFLDGSPGSSRSRGIKCRQRWHRARTIKRAFAKFGMGQSWIAYNFETSFKLSQASNASWIIWVLFTLKYPFKFLISSSLTESLDCKQFKILLHWRESIVLILLGCVFIFQVKLRFFHLFVTWKEQQLLRDIPPNTNVNLAERKR